AYSALAAVDEFMAVAGSCRPLPRAPTAAPGRQPALPGGLTSAPAPVEAYVPGPIVRVGIVVDAPRSVVSADGGLVVREATGTALREVPLPRATFVAVAPAAAGSRYRVQVGSLSDRGAADDFAARVRELAGLEPVVRWSEETRTFQVRVGDGHTRDEAVDLASRLQQLGLSGGWGAGEPGRSTPRRGR